MERKLTGETCETHSYTGQGHTPTATYHTKKETPVRNTYHTGSAQAKEREKNKDKEC